MALIVWGSFFMSDKREGLSFLKINITYMYVHPCVCPCVRACVCVFVCFKLSVHISHQQQWESIELLHDIHFRTKPLSNAFPITQPTGSLCSTVVSLSTMLGFVFVFLECTGLVFCFLSWFLSPCSWYTWF